MTTLEELNQREIEEIRLVREKYERLREHARDKCKHAEGIKTTHGRYTTFECANCGCCLVSLPVNNCGAAMDGSK